MLSLSAEFQLLWYDWAIACIAAMLIGFSKTGFKGISLVTVTLMALVFGSKVSTGIVMPLLIVADTFAVIYFRRSVKWKYLFKLMPWMIVGVLLGAWVGKDLPEEVFKQGMAFIIFVTVIMMFWWDRQKEIKVPDYAWFSTIMGLSAGFTTMIGNLAGAFSNLYFLAIRFPKNEFIGTTAWLFFLINLFKLPFHIFLWETIHVESLAVNIRLIPAVLVGLLVGVRMIKLIREDVYRKMILILTAVGALVILLR